MRQTTVAILIASVLTACSSGPKDADQQTNDQVQSAEKDAPKTTGSIEKLDPELDQILSSESALEILGEGYDWSEGPVWVESQNFLLFSDIPPNQIHKWDEESGASLYLTPSGYTGDVPRVGEPGSNGLLIDPAGRLVLCQHGDRRIARLMSSFDNPEPRYETMVASYQGKRLNSPNDATYKSNGDLYFTDPPYGLEGNVDDPAKEIPFQGVYRFTAGGEIELLTDELSRPNGIAFAPDEKTLYVANSDPERAIWMAYDVNDSGGIENGRVFFDATDKIGTEKGLPDGMKVNSKGIIFATGPGGVFVFNAEGRHLGTLKTGQATANCALGPGEKSLFMTADMYLLRVALK